MKSSQWKRKLLQKKTVEPGLVLDQEYRSLICSQSYLGKKGYTIIKSILKKEDEEFLRKELYVKPMVFGPTYGGKSEETTEFPVFRESANKLYIPRFYGIERYGLPSKTDIVTGDEINLSFPKSLRDYQDTIVNIYIEHVFKPICTGSALFGGGGILEVPCGRGKTVMALKIISLLKKKTLIIVHKEFLMNQWIERINEFLPGATVGKIQGSVFETKGCDIVIGMVQTLYDKDYPADAFSCFGLTVIDEVHRIGSEQFSKTLFKTITPYMLGISATVDRKDKLTRILYMFIGNKIYEEARENDDPVVVRAIEYRSNDEQFNEVETDYRGNAKYSTMIVKLCEFGPRSDFIVRVIKDLIDEEPEQQIMILCHNRSLLVYLHSAIQHKSIASVGFYVGGMKQTELQATETKSIVLATYAMAAEALDIKTLSTLVMVTPKTDITQSIGRILRVKHKKPIVVDVVDKHEVFQNQWIQRRRFYKKCGYRILYTESTAYTNMLVNWEKDTTWKRVFEPKIGEKTQECDEPSTLIGNCLINVDKFLKNTDMP